MPRYYCDYCDTYLTHDSPSVRKQHNAGYKHKANIRAYYQKFEQQQTQILLDQKIKEHLGQAVVYQQIGAAYNQHLASFPGGRPYLPVMPLPGAVPPQLAPGPKPPVLPIPLSGPPAAPGYASAPMVAMHPPPGSSFPGPPGQSSSSQASPNMIAPLPVPGGGPPASTAGMPPAPSQMYNVSPSGATTGSHSHPQIP